jgi:hypothetical protein
MNWRIEYTLFLYRETKLISIGEFSNIQCDIQILQVQRAQQL